MQIDEHGVTIAANHVAVHVPGRPSGRMNAVRRVLGIMFRALEAVIFWQPLHRVVLVGTRERKHIDVTLGAGHNELRRPVHVHAVARWNRVPGFGAVLNPFRQ